MPHEWSHGHFYWNELMTRDAEKAKKFYSTTLGWTFEPMSEDPRFVFELADQLGR